MPNLIPISNFQDDHSIDTVMIFESGVGYTGNLYGMIHNLFPDPPSVGDILYIGSDEPFWHWYSVVKTLGNPSGLTVVYEYSDNAAGWPDLTAGTDLTHYPNATNFFSKPVDTLIGLNAFPGSDWAAEAVNGITKFWIRIRITAVTSWTTMTQVDMDHNPRIPELRIPAGTFKGDITPQVMARLFSPDGGADTPAMSTISRAIVGLKTRGLDRFISRINPGGDGNPAWMTVAYGTDTASAANSLSPGGDLAHTDFSTTTVMTERFTVTLDQSLFHYRGQYRVFVVAQQSTGDPGDVVLQMVAKIGSSDVDAPAIPFPEVQFLGTTVGEIVELTPQTTLNLPFGDAKFADREAMRNTDVVLEFYAERTTGAALLNWYQIILIPSEEWISVGNDPVSDPDTGNSALRGNTLLELDTGVIANRTIKRLIRNGDLVLAETWSRGSGPMKIEPDLEARLYFLFGRYETDWGDPPFIADQGISLVGQIYGRDRHQYLRGNE